MTPRYHLSQPGAYVEARGHDAFAFLQSQFSNDLSGKSCPGGLTYGLWLDRKGKVQADSFALQADDSHFRLLSYFCPAETLIAFLGDKIIMDDVELIDKTVDYRLLTVIGAGAEILAKLGGPALQSLEERCWCETDGVIDGAFAFPGRRSTDPATEFLLPEAEALKAAKLLAGAEGSLGDGLEDPSKIFSELQPADMEAERISAGIPRIPEEIGPDDLPQEGRLEDDAVSFTKGCFLGQEVMARLHSMGKAQRSLERVAGPIPAPTKLPAPLFAGEKAAGELRTAVEGEERFLGQAILKRRMLESNHAFALEKGGEPVVEVLGV